MKKSQQVRCLTFFPVKHTFAIVCKYTQYIIHILPRERHSSEKKCFFLSVNRHLSWYLLGSRLCVTLSLYRTSNLKDPQKQLKMRQPHSLWWFCVFLCFFFFSTVCFHLVIFYWSPRRQLHTDDNATTDFSVLPKDTWTCCQDEPEIKSPVLVFYRRLPYHLSYSHPKQSCHFFVSLGLYCV